MIRKIKKEDLSDIISLLKQLWPGFSLNPDETATLLDRYLKDGNYDIYCFEDKKILGIITISKRWAFYYGGQVAVIEDIVVDEKNRGRGIGTKLVKFVEKELEKEGVKSIEVVSDLHRNQAHQFWENIGYSKTAFQLRKILVNK